MDGLIYARAQMGLSLAFHIVFAAVGVALPLLMVLSDLRYAKTRDPDYLELSKRLAKGTGILFAIGAVSGTVLSFELGLLWPTFMGRFGEAARRRDRLARRSVCYDASELGFVAGSPLRSLRLLSRSLNRVTTTLAD
jgi:hypothetical protein